MFPPLDESLWQERLGDFSAIMDFAAGASVGRLDFLRQLVLECPIVGEVQGPTLEAVSATQHHNT